MKLMSEIGNLFFELLFFEHVCLVKYSKLMHDISVPVQNFLSEACLRILIQVLVILLSYETQKKSEKIF